jgi:hypothetical protein
MQLGIDDPLTCLCWRLAESDVTVTLSRVWTDHAGDIIMQLM